MTQRLGAAPLQAPFFNYFADDYRWSSGLLMALGSAPWGGADIGEVHEAGRALADRVGDDAAWFAQWRALGDRLRERAQGQERAGRRLTAAASALRAASYYQIGERFARKDGTALEVFRTSVDCFATFARLTDRPRIERVEVPYEAGEALPAYLVHPAAPGGGPVPAVVFFDGLDITKELQYLRGVEELARRGIACLVVDGPGNGESIRFRGLHLRHDYDVAGTAAYEYLAARHEIDAGRVAVMGISLGGYYATRSAAFEPRFAACVAWGAIWDYEDRWRKRLAAATVPMSVPLEHIAWTFGVDSAEKALEPLADWKLAGVAARIRVPFLVVHGGHDQQVPMADAQALLDEVSATDKRLLVYPEGTPGAEHCQLDSPVPAMHDIADWLAATLR